MAEKKTIQDTAASLVAGMIDKINENPSFSLAVVAVTVSQVAPRMNWLVGPVWDETKLILMGGTAVLTFIATSLFLRGRVIS